jgi:ABC-type phosphate/phosphonate transport system substrate-binding protein
VAAIDSQVLAVALRDQPEIESELRVIGSLGPSTIQPFVVSRRLPAALREALRAALLELGHDAAGRLWLARGLVERFAPVTDASYDDIRWMTEVAAGKDRSLRWPKHFASRT